jgi:hypothetical protein
MTMRNVQGKSLVELMILMAICAIFTALIFGANGGCLIGCNEDYSEGERTGVVTKLSYKGFSKKTWEGEMNLGGFSSDVKGNLQANLWSFTVPEDDEDNRKIIQEAQRTQRAIVIRYKEWMIRPGCQTDSGYIVQSVEFVKTDRKEGDKR